MRLFVPALFALALTAGAASSSAQPAVLPDIVRLKGGGFVRGTIVEHDPRGRTVVQTENGKRTFEADEVVFAGLAARDPGGAAPAPRPEETPPRPPAEGATPIVAPPERKPPPAAARLHLRSDQNDVRFYALPLGKRAVPGEPGLVPLCTAPCEASIERGAYRLALARGSLGPLWVNGSFELKPDATVRGNVLSRTYTRAAGWTLGAISAVPFVYGIATAIFASGKTKGRGPVVAAVGGAGMLAGLVITRAQDIAEASPVDDVPPPKSSSAEPSGRVIGATVGGEM